MRAVEVSGDIVSSALYSANWLFAAQSVDYFAQAIEPSPVLHFWSLAIEEQFYLVWPTLLLGGHLALAPARPLGPPGALGHAGGRSSSARFALGVQLTDEQPAAAYFSTFGRAWELASGRRWRCSGRSRSARGRGGAIGWPGLGAIVYAALAFDAEHPVPRASPPWCPTLGTACLILAGSSIYAQAQARPGRPALAGAGPLRRPDLLLLVPLALAGADLRRGDLGPALGRRRPRGRRRLLDPHAVDPPPGSRTPCAVSRVLARRPEPRARGRPRLHGGRRLRRASLLTDLQPTLNTAPLADVKGAAALPEQPYPQQRADAVRPEPAARPGRPLADVLRRLPGRDRRNQLEQVPLRRPRGQTHADPLRRLARDAVLPGPRRARETHHWRLIALTKAECTPGEVKIRSMVADREYSQCDAWREDACGGSKMGDPGPPTVVMSGDTAYTAYGADGGTERQRRGPPRWKPATSRP